MSGDPTAGTPEAFFAAVASVGVSTVDVTRGVELFLGCKDAEAAAQVRITDRFGHCASLSPIAHHCHPWCAGQEGWRLSRPRCTERICQAHGDRHRRGAERNERDIVDVCELAPGVATAPRTDATGSLPCSLPLRPLALAAQVAGSLDDLAKYNVSVEGEDFDFLLPPLVQSGGTYNTHIDKPGLASTADKFASDVVIFSAAMRWKQHAALVARTYFVDPSPSQQLIYDAMHEAQAVRRAA